MQLEGEPTQIFRRMMVLDGNNSLKRMKSTRGQREVGDTRELSDSSYFLSNTYVNSFENEIRRPAPTRVKQEAEDELVDGDEGYITEAGEPQLENCASNWKAAASTEKKKMWGVFDETGIFASACPHGFVLWLADMIQSGELCVYSSTHSDFIANRFPRAKYPLSMVAKAMDAFGPRLLIGYDIGCVFGRTILSTSLGAKFRESCSRTCVNAFHGYSHNFECQCKNHPNNIAGMGLEDLETLERVFSSSNVLAVVTRYASAYRRRLYIEMHFKQWDEDKYSNLATMLRNNYHQALDIIKKDGRAVEEAKRSLGVTDENLDSWKAEQEEYFLTLGDEPESKVRAIAYVELLQKLRQLE
jgi:hypothetical protein